MGAQAEFRAAIEAGDFKRLRQLHSAVLPHLPEPKNDEEAATSLHMARTQADWLAGDARCYSHAWLIERGLPSQLPDGLKPQAERLYPRIVEAVFVSANTNSPLMKPIAERVQRAMCDAVEEAAADGRLSDSSFVRSRMHAARARTFKHLLGINHGGHHG